MTTGGVPGPGWYADPWFSGQHRYWTGSAWTADVFPDAPTSQIVLRPEGERPPAAPPTLRSSTPPPAPTFGYAQAPTTVFAPWETLESPPAPPRRRLSSRQINAIALGTGLVVGFAVVAAVLVNHGGNSTSAAPPANPPAVPTLPLGPSPTSSAPASTDPDASALQGLVVRQGDVPPSSSVQLLPGGNLVAGQTTLDLCNGTYPSESLRSARLQVVEYDGSGDSVLSTEAVLYRTPADAAQAMNEVRRVARTCPNSPVVSPVGEPTVTTRFQAAPDRSWPTVGGVDRAAFAFTSTDQFGQTSQQVAVYLRRGRVLEGVYFGQPVGAQPAVDGNTTLAGILRDFEERIVALPASVTSG